MSDNTIRAITPLCLGIFGVLLITIGVLGRSFGKLEATDFNTIANISLVAFGGAAGTAQTSGKRITAENVENIEMESSDTPTKM
jgi:hypothetical protein